MSIVLTLNYSRDLYEIMRLDRTTMSFNVCTDTAQVFFSISQLTTRRARKAIAQFVGVKNKIDLSFKLHLSECVARAQVTKE